MSFGPFRLLAGRGVKLSFRKGFAPAEGFAVNGFDTAEKARFIADFEDGIGGQAEEMEIAASRVASFKAGKALKDAVAK
jgi:hypothetical protein